MVRRDAPPNLERETSEVKLQYSLRSLFLLTAVIAVLLAIPNFWPRSTKLGMFPDEYVGFYHGLGLHEGPGYFGTNWYRVVVTEPDKGYFEVDVDGPGYNSYRGFYPNGTLRERGTCLVEENGDLIWPDRHQILNGEYFSPDGKLLSKVENGTGRQILCYPDGQPSRELDLEDGKYIHLRQWHPNGQLDSEHVYRNERVHGDFKSYYPNGQIRSHGEYADGERTGKWILYREDGSVESTEEYADGKRTGIWIFYREDGSVEHTADFTGDTDADTPDTP